MKTFLALACFVLSISTMAVEVDGVVARVGSDVILRSDVINEMRRIGEQDGTRFNEIRNEMIDRKLILKAAVESKMTMQDWVVENRVREIVKKSFGGDRNKLIDMLSKQKVSYPEWLSKLKEDMIVSAMRWNVVDKNVSASPSEMRREFEGHRERYSTGRSVSVSVILLKPEESGKREEISAAIKDRSFEELGGKKYENVNPEDLFRPEIVDEINSMPKGTISHWVEIDGWSFLLKKDSESKGESMTFDEAYDLVEAHVKEENAKKAYLAWIDRLRAETYVKVF